MFQQKKHLGEGSDAFSDGLAFQIRNACPRTAKSGPMLARVHQFLHRFCVATPFPYDQRTRLAPGSIVVVMKGEPREVDAIDRTSGSHAPPTGREGSFFRQTPHFSTSPSGEAQCERILKGLRAGRGEFPPAWHRYSIHMR